MQVLQQHCIDELRAPQPILPDAAAYMIIPKLVPSNTAGVLSQMAVAIYEQQQATQCQANQAAAAAALQWGQRLQWRALVTASTTAAADNMLRLLLEQPMFQDKNQQGWGPAHGCPRVVRMGDAAKASGRPPAPALLLLARYDLNVPHMPGCPSLACTASSKPANNISNSPRGATSQSYLCAASVWAVRPSEGLRGRVRGNENRVSGRHVLLGTWD